MAGGRPVNGLPRDLEMVRGRRVTAGPIQAFFAMEPGDRPLVAAGEAVVRGTPIIDRLRDGRTEVVGGVLGDEAEPGTWWVGEESPGRRGTPRALRGELLFQSAGRWRITGGDPGEALESPVGGVVAEVRPGSGLTIRTSSRGLLGSDVIGSPVIGRLAIAASRDGHLRASEIDVRAADSILVAGAHIDAEAITRARAVGVRGIVVAGLGIKERREIIASEERSRASLHGVAPFAVLVLEGAIGRPIATPVMAVIDALEGRDVAIVADPAALVADSERARLPAPRSDLVGIAAGPLAGTEGRWGGLAGPVRFTGGVILEAGFVVLEGREPIAVPLGDLERYV